MIVDSFHSSCYVYHMTIEQTVEIPADRRVFFLEEIWALCKDAPVTVDSFLEERRWDNEKDAYGIFKDLKGMDTTIERDEEDRV
jgi:hypothetical protein